MNQDIFAGQWQQIRGELRSWWGKISDDDFERIGGQKDKLVGMVQEKYGYAREKAQQEVDRRFKEYGDKMSGPNGGGKRDTATAVLDMPGKAPHDGVIATAATAITGGLESAQGAISTAATAVADRVEAMEGAIATGWESAQGVISTAATAVADGVESAQGAISTAATAVAGGVESANTYMQEKTFQEMAGDLTAVIRTYPVQSLLVGAALGYLFARLTAR